MTTDNAEYESEVTQSADGTDRFESYRDQCPKCGATLLGMSKEEYVEHLRENGETLAAKIEERMIVAEGER